MGLWDSPLRRIHSRFASGTQKEWAPIKAAPLAAPKRTRYNKQLEDLLSVCQATLDKFPSDAEQYRILVEKAHKNPCWFPTLLRDAKLTWDPSRGEIKPGEPEGAFVEVPAPGEKAALAQPDELRDLYALIPNPEPAEMRSSCGRGAASPGGSVRTLCRIKRSKDSLERPKPMPKPSSSTSATGAARRSRLRAVPARASAIPTSPSLPSPRRLQPLRASPIPGLPAFMGRVGPCWRRAQGRHAGGSMRKPLPPPGISRDPPRSPRRKSRRPRSRQRNLRTWRA